MASPQFCTFCPKQEEDTCRRGYALIRGDNSNILNIYILGPIEPFSLAQMIHHNNIYHKGDTGGQMAELCKIIEESKKIDKYYDKNSILAAIRKHLIELQNSTYLVRTVYHPPNYPSSVPNNKTTVPKNDDNYHNDHLFQINVNKITLDPPFNAPLTEAEIDNDVMVVGFVPPPPPGVFVQRQTMSKKRLREMQQWNFHNQQFF